MSLAAAKPDFVCTEKASFGWHQFGISVAHAKAWEMAQRTNSWTVILEQDAAFVKAGKSKTWWELANYILAEAPEETEFVWLSGQKQKDFALDGPLLMEGATFCPHTYAISPAGATKLLEAARKTFVYGAVDIFLIHELPKVLKTYMVNDKRAVHEGLMELPPEESSPRNLGIGFQQGFKKEVPKEAGSSMLTVAPAGREHKKNPTLMQSYSSDELHDLPSLPNPKVVLFRHRKAGSSWVSSFFEKLLREDKSDGPFKEHLKTFIPLDEAMSARRGAVKALKAAGVITVTTIRHPIARYLSEAKHCGPLARCSGDEARWASYQDSCPPGYPENKRRTSDAAMWTKWREAGKQGCPLTGNVLVRELCINGTENVELTGKNGTETKDMNVRCRSKPLRWPRALYVGNYFVRRLMGDPGCEEINHPVKFFAYDDETRKNAETSSAFFADQANLLCEECRGCKCGMAKRLTKQDLELAKANLHDIDIVIVEEHPELVKAPLMLLFGSKVQKDITETVINEECRRANDTSLETRAQAKDEIPQVYRENAYDMELWEHAISVAKQRSFEAERLLRLR